MRRKYFALIIAGISLFLAASLNAQIRVGFQVNIGAQPVWGPVGYDAAQYYYLPDIDVYYSIPLRVFYFYDGVRWIKRPNLPPRYKAFDLYHAYKVVINEKRPWLHGEVYRVKYASFKGRHDQVIIRDSHDPKYFVIKEHPEHTKVIHHTVIRTSTHEKVRTRESKHGENGKRENRRERER